VRSITNGGAGQSLFHLAALESARQEDICRRARVHDGAAARADHIHRRPQWFSVHDHEGSGVLGSIPSAATTAATASPAKRASGQASTGCSVST